MLGLSDLKADFSMTETEVGCPVQGCNAVVRRRRRADGELKAPFLCKTCKIYVYPSTFEYVDEADNLLWTAKDDFDLLNEIKRYKAEIHRLGHDNSEDAVTWNVFRHFDRSVRLPSLLSHLTERNDIVYCEAIYWSYYPAMQEAWKPLVEARVEFGEAASLKVAAMGKRVSEPDIILLTNDSVIFVEAKFTSKNKTSGDANRVKEILSNPKRYLSGGNEWYPTVFTSDFPTVVLDQKYELLRFWLLGSWIANALGKKFVLANLVRHTEEIDIEDEFGKHIRQTESNRFVRWTWESLASLLVGSEDGDSAHLLAYLKNKTIRFKPDDRHPIARPQKAFTFE